jgi:hypothetical protein
VLVLEVTLVSPSLVGHASVCGSLSGRNVRYIDNKTMAAQPQQLPFRPLEYWKPPKAVQHIRSRSTNEPAKPQRSPSVYSFSSSKKDIQLRDSSDSYSVDRKHTTYTSAVEIMKNQFVEGTGEYDRPRTVSHKWYNVKAWGKKIWIGITAAVIILIIIIIVAAVETNKNNSYPDYSALKYSVSETCKSKDSFLENH